MKYWDCIFFEQLAEKVFQIVSPLFFIHGTHPENVFFTRDKTVVLMEYQLIDFGRSLQIKHNSNALHIAMKDD